MTTNRTITHDGTLVLKFPPRRDLVAGACLNAGTRISTRDGPETFWVVDHSRPPKAI